MMQKIYNVKRIYSEKNNQFYQPLKMMANTKTIYMKVVKNHSKEHLSKQEILRMEQYPDYSYVVMHDDDTTAEQHFFDVMNSNRDTYVKLNELDCFIKNMLYESISAIQKLKEIAESPPAKRSADYDSLKNIYNKASVIYEKLFHRERIDYNRSTYIGQNLPSEIIQTALSKRLFIERSDDYCKKGSYRVPCSKNERKTMQALYPCGYIVRNISGIVIAGKCFEMNKEQVTDFVNKYVPVKTKKKCKYFYKIPISLEDRKKLAKCHNILKKYGLYYRNQHNCFFWVMNRNREVVAGGKSGFGIKGLVRYCRKMNKA